MFPQVVQNRKHLKLKSVTANPCNQHVYSSRKTRSYWERTELRCVNVPEMPQSLATARWHLACFILFANIFNFDPLSFDSHLATFQTF